ADLFPVRRPKTVATEIRLGQIPDVLVAPVGIEIESDPDRTVPLGGVAEGAAVERRNIGQDGLPLAAEVFGYRCGALRRRRRLARRTSTSAAEERNDHGQQPGASGPFADPSRAHVRLHTNLQLVRIEA